jgi:ComF family protein
MAAMSGLPRALDRARRRAGRHARRAWRGLAAFALPQACPECGAAASPARVLCRACWDAVPAVRVAVCVRCLGAGRPPVGCARHAAFQVWPAWVYAAGAEAVIAALKFEERPRVAAALGAAMARVAPLVPRADLVVPVPLHAARRRERGYDQASALAHALGKALGVPVLDCALERVRATTPQTRLDARERRANLAGAFRVREPGCWSGRRVLVVDDVVTTGATFEAALSMFAAAGANPCGVAAAWAQ